MPIDYRAEGAIAHITIRNGELNLLTPVEFRGLHEAVTAMLADEQVRVGILSGAGTRAFSAGADLTFLDTHDDVTKGALEELTPRSRRPGQPPDWEYDSDVQALERYKPIIGVVHGWCLGGGLILLLQLTDIRVCSPNAQFGLPEIAYGMGGAGGMTRLGRQIPPVAAMSLLLTGDPISAAEAARVFLVNEVVPGDDLVQRATQIASRIAEHPPLGVRVEMEASARGMDLDRLSALRYAERLYQLQRLAIGESDRSSFEAARARRGATGSRPHD